MAISTDGMDHLLPALQTDHSQSTHAALYFMSKSSIPLPLSLSTQLIWWFTVMDFDIMRLVERDGEICK